MQATNFEPKADSNGNELSLSSLPLINRIALPIIASLGVGFNSGCVTSQAGNNPLVRSSESTVTQKTGEDSPRMEVAPPQIQHNLEYTRPGLVTCLRQADAWFSVLVGAEQANPGGLERLSPEVTSALRTKFYGIRRELAGQLDIRLADQVALPTRQRLESVLETVSQFSNLNNRPKLGSSDRAVREVLLVGHTSLHEIFDLEGISNASSPNLCGNNSAISRSDFETQTYFENLFGLAQQNHKSLAKRADADVNKVDHVTPSAPEPERRATTSERVLAEAVVPESSRKNERSAVTWDPFISKQQAPASMVEEASIWVGLIGGAYALAKIAAPFFGVYIP